MNTFGGKFIVKVQVPLSTNGEPEALIYDETREVQAMVPVTDVTSRMKDRPKAFFWATIRADAKSRVIELHDEAPWQDW